MKLGDIVEIQSLHKWGGFRAKIVHNGDGVSMPYLEPLSDRPDGYERKEFFWDRDELVVVPPVVESLW